MKSGEAMSPPAGPSARDTHTHGGHVSLVSQPGEDHRLQRHRLSVCGGSSVDERFAIDRGDLGRDREREGEGKREREEGRKAVSCRSHWHCELEGG
mmetsp:Transcript_8316/g.23657  ORF Transcript_8316/g.23657 Transcript_8316/m.23657 type:complete len:96 (-) Transcript_8316:4-291(-)